MDEEKSEGIILRSIDYKERQRIITVFTADYGLISLIVKNISRRNPHLLSLSTPFCLAEYLYLRGKSDLFKFQDGTVLDEMLSLRNSFSHLQAAGDLARAILHSQLPGKSSPELYSLFAAYMKHIPYFENTTLLATSFYLKMLKHEGMLALTPLCSVCETAASRYLHRGECVCNEHAPSGAQLLSPAEFQLIQELLTIRSFEQLKTLNINPELSVKLETVVKLALLG